MGVSDIFLKRLVKEIILPQMFDIQTPQALVVLFIVDWVIVKS